MTQEDLLLAAIVREPGDDLAWLALADRLEEMGQAPRAELLRLTRRLRELPWDDTSGRPDAEKRVVALLAAGVAPANPEMMNATGVAFRLIPPGRFLMGAADGEEEGTRERPRHEVVITRPFWMGVYPVTQGQFEAVMGNNPSYFRKGGDGKSSVRRMKTADFPVESVTWHEAAEFGVRIGARLPSEAEWEYACRAGSSQPFHTGRALKRTDANIDDRLNRPCPVGLYAPNAHGLHDLHGNVWEWCHDWLGEDYYSHSPAADPAGPVSGTGRAYRGGGWSGHASTNRSAARGACTPDFRSNRLGFRVVCEWSGG
jgi:uncharacterized protein (TIGR02996 family)